MRVQLTKGFRLIDVLVYGRPSGRGNLYKIRKVLKRIDECSQQQLDATTFLDTSPGGISRLRNAGVMP